MAAWFMRLGHSPACMELSVMNTVLHDRRNSVSTNMQLKL